MTGKSPWHRVHGGRAITTVRAARPGDENLNRIPTTTIGAIRQPAVPDGAMRD